MAKKKRTTKKTASRSKKKTATKKRSKKSVRKSTSRKSAPAKITAGRGNNSVDSLLKKFAKERSQKESQLESLRKKKRELEEKARKFQEQVSKLSQQERDAQAQIAQLDKQRDHDVSQLLSKLGIQLGGGNHGSSAKDPHAKHGDQMKHSRDRAAVPMPNGRTESR